MMFNVSILGGSKLGTRPWKPGKKLWAVALLGGTLIDFRQAQLDENETEVVCISFLGGMGMIVPPDVPVSVSGFSLLGGRSVEGPEAGQALPASGKGLRVRAFAILGGVGIVPPKGKKP